MITTNGTAAIEVRGLVKRYGDKTALRGISFRVEPGELVAVLGPSGAGKTTLFRCITRLVEPDAGEMFVHGNAIHAARGRDLREARREIGLIFQQFNLIRRMNALENVLAGRLGRAPTWRVLTRRFAPADRQLALASLDRVGLLPQAYQRADSLSGGQQQRVAIARVLAQQSHVVLADEPVASLDPASAASVLETLRSIAHERRIAVLCNLHQVQFALEFADRVIGLRNGELIADVPTGKLSTGDQAAIYEGVSAESAVAATAESVRARLV